MHKVLGKVIVENEELCLRKIWADFTEEVTFVVGLKGWIGSHQETRCRKHLNLRNSLYKLTNMWENTVAGLGNLKNFSVDSLGSYGRPSYTKVSWDELWWAMYVILKKLRSFFHQWMVTEDSSFTEWHVSSDRNMVMVLAKKGMWRRGRASLGERWDTWSWRYWEDPWGGMSSSHKCREEVGLADVCDREVLVEAPEVNEMTQTKRPELEGRVLTSSPARRVFQWFSVVWWERQADRMNNT